MEPGGGPLKREEAKNVNGYVKKDGEKVTRSAV